ncbi:hypothetical protein BJX66DRAFT_310736 [Aspergillus keveii]|uniref:Nucleoside phosphorylase domain-containing protein n=1 Tax=Aspergillus keveii TaxID=714993 RepID=A0ABR4FW82_9EURO
MSAVPRPNRRRDFELAIICALPLEADAVIALFDHHHSEDGEEGYGKAADDQNAYTTGVIGNHNIVVAHMPGMGKVSAAGVAVGLRMSFPNIKLALVVGICGGVPGGLNAREIYLGDVVISQCLVQYDFGKQYPMAFEPKDSIQGGSGVPPIAVQALLRKLETHYHSAGLQEDTNMFLRELQENSRRALYPGAEFDQLFKPLYLHQHRSLTDCATCGEDGSHACANAIVTACQELGCGAEGLVHRERNSDNHEQVFWPSIHFGRMGSGDTVMKSGTHRDGIARRDGIIAFEMEGAGVYAYFPSLVIKGVCDYADSHKNKQWQDYAAAAAAACTKAFLKRWASERVHHDLVAKPAVKPIFMVDILRDNSLIGREDVMQFLENKLSPERHNRVALVALGGIGKTRIALEYALRLKDSSVSVFWIHASTKARILDCYAKIAKKANLVGYDVKAADSGDPQPVKEWLEGDSCGRWLIILDNADDHDLLYGSSRLIDIFPRSENGSILMTTRDKKVGFDFAGASRLFPLQRLGSDQAQELLLSKFDGEANLDPASCKELCDELEGIPLAIVQASAFMHQNSITAEEYLEYYRESSDAQISLLSEDFEDSVRDKDSKNPVAATWVISFEYIEKKVPLAGELLKRMSILDSHAIPTSLIQTEDPRHNQIKALGTLQAFCLITARQSATKRAKETDKRYDLHRLVRLAARNWLKQRGLLLQQTAEVLRIVAEKYPEVESTGIKEMDRCTAYLPHAIAVLASGEIQGTGEGGLGEVAPAFRGQQMMAEHSRHEVPCAVCAGDLMMNVSRTFELTPPREGSIRWVMAAVALRTFVFGQSHQRTIEALILAAMTFYDVKQIEQARMFGEKAVLLIETATDPPAPLVAWKFEIMGFVQMVYGGLPNEYFRKAIETRVAAFGPDHAEVTRTKLHLSSTYLNQGRFAEYEELMKDIIDSDTRTHGPASVRALAAKWSLAKNYALNGRRREALLLRTQIAASESGVGEGKNLQNDLFLFHSCLSQSDVGNHDEAVKLAEQILELGSETCIPRLTSMKLLATCYEQQGRYAEAEELRIKVMRQATKVEREESPEAIESMGDLADLYGRRGKYKEAILLRERIVKIGIKRLGKPNPKILLNMCELGLNYSFLGQLDKAAKYRYSSLNYPLETPEARLPSHIDRMATIARELNLHDEYIEAEKLGWAAVGLLRMHEKATQYRAARSVTWLADTYARLNNIEQAEELYREALDILSFGDGISYEALSVRTKLASLLLREARYTEAEALAAETRGNLSGLEYPNQQSIISNLRTLAAVYAEQGRFSLAELRCSDLLARLQSNTPKPEDLAPSSVLNAVNDLETVALTYEGARRYEKAGNIYRKTIAIRNQLKGSSNLRTLKATTRYIDTMNSQAHYSEALALGLECKERYQQREKQATAFEEMILASIDKGLAVSFAGLANYTNAEPLAREALETYCRNVGCDHPQYLDCLVVLTWILREKNDTNLSEVKEMGVQVLEGWTKVVGEKHLRTAEAMEALALTCGKIGDQEEAECLKRIAGEIREGLDLGLEGEEKKKLDDLVQQLLADFGADNDEFALAIGRLRVG